MAPKNRFVVADVPPIVDPEFKAVLEVHDEETRKALREKIMAEGFREPLTVWGDPDTPEHLPNILIDGHNRLDIASELKVRYTVRYLKLPGMDPQNPEHRAAVVSWIIENQLCRRNLSPTQRTYLIGKLLHESKSGKLPDLNGEDLAERFKVSRRTVSYAAKFAEAVDADPQMKQKVLEGGKVPNPLRQKPKPAPKPAPAPGSKPAVQPHTLNWDQWKAGMGTCVRVATAFYTQHGRQTDQGLEDLTNLLQQAEALMREEYHAITGRKAPGV